MHRLQNWGFRITMIYFGFVIFILTLVVIATRQKFDLVSSNYYERELNYESQIQKLRRAAKNQITPEIKNRQLTLIFKNPSLSKGTVLLYRPANAQEDITITLEPKSGKQEIDLSNLSKGLWRAKFEWTENSNDFYQEELIWIE